MANNRVVPANLYNQQFNVNPINRNAFNRLSGEYVNGVNDDDHPQLRDSFRVHGNVQNAIDRVGNFGYYRSDIEIFNVGQIGSIPLNADRNFSFFIVYYLFVSLHSIFTRAIGEGQDANYFIRTNINTHRPLFSSNVSTYYAGDPYNFGARQGHNAANRPLTQMVVNRIIANNFDYDAFSYLYSQIRTIYQSFRSSGDDALVSLNMTVSVTFIPRPLQGQGGQPIPRNRRPINVPVRRNQPQRIEQSIAQRVAERRRRQPPNRAGFAGQRMFFGITSENQSCVMNVLGIGTNPSTDDNLCFITAVLKSQIRTFLSDHREVLESCDTVDGEIFESDYTLSMFYETDEVYPSTSYCRMTEEGSVQVNIGNTLYRQNIDVDTLVRVAHLIEISLEEAFAVEIGSNHWCGIPQAFSNLYGVYFHIFDSHMNGRFKIIYPENDYGYDYTTSNIHRHIYLYEKEGHIYPIKNISLFINSPKILKTYNLCDCCQFVIKKNKGVCIDHIARCHSMQNFVTSQTNKFTSEVLKRKPFYRYYPVGYGKFLCNVCMKTVYQSSTGLTHVCYMPKPQSKPYITDSKLYALDIESMQVTSEQDPTKMAHRCVLICVRSIYNREEMYQFETEQEFTDHLIKNKKLFQGAVFLAHNGGGYDYQFFLRHWEHSNLKYEHIPRPGSKHKYLELKFYFDNSTSWCRFIDFMMLVPESLRSVGESFGLEVQKGDFPHRFLNEATRFYVGPIPPLHSDDDWFSYKSKKSKLEQQHLQEWYDKQLLKYCSCRGVCWCRKEKWDCNTFLEEYCWLDVHVLADAARAYRDMIMNLEDTSDNIVWKGQGYDPFLCITQSQLAMQIFLSGWGQNMPCIYVPKHNKPDFNWKSIEWLEGLQPRGLGGRILHRGNYHSMYYVEQINFLCDGYQCDGDVQTVYIFADCKEYCCERCYPEDYIHPVYKRPNIKIREEFENDLVYLRSNFNVVVMKECDYITNEQNRVAFQIYTDREMFYGGRTEVFTPYANAALLNQKFSYHDVCSMYPHVCSKKVLPIGIPTFLFGDMIHRERLNPNHRNPYFGFARIRVVPPKKDFLGLLPSRNENGRLLFHLEEQVGYWHTSEIYLALENCYVITEVYQVIHFEKEQRSDTLFRGYMEYFLRLKIEADGWKKMGATSENPTDVQKDHLCEMSYQNNGQMARPRRDEVAKNPVKRKIAKIFLNCLWGKFCQVQNKEVFCDITNFSDYQYLVTTSEVMNVNVKFRMSPSGALKTSFDLEGNYLRPNKKYNIFIAASVTAEARCILHRRMLLIGPERVMYCDTDSIIFHSDEGEDQAMLGSGLGEFTDEYAGEKITHFYAIAPKFYFVVTENSMHIKSKGIWLTEENKLLLNEESIRSLIENYFFATEEESIVVKNMSIFSNTTDMRYDYATMFTRYNEKRVTCQFTKRQFFALDFVNNTDLLASLEKLQLYPVGYERD